MTELDPIAHFPVVVRFSDEPPASDWYLFNAPRPLSGDGAWEGDWLAGVFYASVNPQGLEAGRHIRDNRDAQARVVVTIAPAQARGVVERHYRRVLAGDLHAKTLGDVLSVLQQKDDDAVATILVSLAQTWTYSDAMRDITA